MARIGVDREEIAGCCRGRYIRRLTRFGSVLPATGSMCQEGANRACGD